MTNAICEGNRLYNDLYGDTSIYLDVDDVLNSFGNDFNIQSRDQVFYFSNVNGYSSLKDYVQSQRRKGKILLGELNIICPNKTCWSQMHKTILS